VSYGDEPVPEGQHLVDQTAYLVPIVQDDGVDAVVDAHQLEVQIPVALQRLSPVAA